MLSVEISWNRDYGFPKYEIDVYRECRFTQLPDRIPVSIRLPRTYKRASRASVVRLIALIIKRGGAVSENENSSYGTGFYKRGW